MKNDPENRNQSGEPNQDGPQPGQPASLASSGKVIQPISTNLKALDENKAAQETVTAPTIINPASVNLDDKQAQPQVVSPGLVTSQPATNNTFLTGSQIQPEKKKLPIGIYVIAGFNLLGFIAGFFDSSQSSAVYTIAMLISLLLAIGLIMRIEAARKFILWMSGIILVITAGSLLLLVGLQQRLQQRRTDYESAASRIDQRRITRAQKQQLEAINATIKKQEKQAGKAISFTYFKLGVTAVESVVVVVYLTRPRVKEVFQNFDT